ncbi:F0F1 ATP synthase subunit delta [Haloechinothrix sp. YIM 98757]|uniref:ATP synthase subunit delta n=1 Tax=Haloechinothrix aidingensis TaxID=2752311 RepID=A0A838A9A0_9PSEU|nr:F0F1 ATP synthase subunit delta [Haloechinothrix aidingensis]MBA0125201.1 F0F1 ATP synthase subunit delta [Haloechinothrix aidingensis]
MAESTETTLHAASREALELAEGRLGEILDDPGANPAVVGEELYAFAYLLSTEISLRRAVADASSEDAARTRLVRSLLEGKVSEPTLQILDTVVASKWSTPRELLEGTTVLGASALLIGAEREGTLETVEAELFQAARVLTEESALDNVLADRTTPADSKRRLVRELFSGKLTSVTQTMLEQVAIQPRGRSVANALDKLAAQAAHKRERSVAHVVTATELTEEQRGALTERLQRIYGRSMAVHVQVKPDLIGGLLIKVGDEVIDGSTAGRLRSVRGRLAR